MNANQRNKLIKFLDHISYKLRRGDISFLFFMVQVMVIFKDLQIDFDNDMDLESEIQVALTKLKEALEISFDRVKDNLINLLMEKVEKGLKIRLLNIEFFEHIASRR